MPTECAESGCVNQTDSGICQQCAAEQKYGTTSRNYDADGSRVELREGETRDDDSHADVVAKQLAEADDEDLEAIDESEDDDREVRTDGGYQIEGAQLIGREYNVRLSYTVDFDLNLLAGPEGWQAIDEAKLRTPVLHSEPTDWDLVHHDIESVREIYEDEPEACEIADWIDAPSAPSEETYWDDSRHFEGEKEVRTDGGQTERKTLKFDSGPSTTLALADQTNSLAATVRYDDEKDLSEGDEIDVLSAHTGDKIGTASIEHTEIVPVRKALDVITMHWADYGIQQAEYLISRLNSYYGETITATTDVKVLILNPSIRPSDDREIRTDGGLEPPTLPDEWPTECSNPDWSDNCTGDLETERECKKGLCEGCMAVIRSWSDDDEDTDETAQTRLVTDGGTDMPSSDMVHGEKEAIAGGTLLAASVTGWILDAEPLLFAATGVFFITIGFWKNKSLQTTADTEGHQ